MKVLITGASGFIGSHLAADLQKLGHEVVPLTRKHGHPGIHWDPERGKLEREKLEGADVIINLAGESVAEHWNERRKKHIYNSRVAGTRLLAEAIASLERKPQVFLCASAIGYYGERGEEILTEDSGPGKTFLSKVCVDWEAAAQSLSACGVRTASLRFGIVLSTAGGALPRMIAPFHMGAGGHLGSGKQYMSWIALADALSAIRFVMDNQSIAGPVNIVSPHPVTNLVFTQTLGHALHRPVLMPVPTMMIHLTFGAEMADQVLLASDRVLPERLSAAGFQFAYGQLEPALQHILHA